MPIGSHELEGATLAHGRYVITSKLGEGGMGTVYRALDQNIESDVVIKIPRQVMMEDPEFANRFTREIRSLVKLSHPHIVKVSDVGTWESIPFAVMQFLPGGSLEDRRAEGPGRQPLPCDPKTVPRWLDAVAQALDYIHAQGFVHRDVKPGNILFDAQGHAFLSDFGVAKVLASAADQHPSRTAMTGTGMVLGTPEYMAPELIMGEAFDGRVDQYALAVTVYELLCGRRPFENETKTKILVLHTSKAPPRLTEWCPEMPEPLSQAVLKGLSKDPIERYPTCAAFAAAVAATVARAVAQQGRVRFRCPQCKKAGGMAAADYARLRDSGGRPSCAACKIPLEVIGSASEGTAAGSRAGCTMAMPQSGGTMVMDQPGDSGGYGLGGVPAVDRTAARSGTMAMTGLKNDAEAETDPEPRPITPRRGSQTIVERPLQPSRANVTVAMSAVDVQVSPGLTSPEQMGPANSGIAGGPRPNPVQTWISIGAGAGAAVLLVPFLIFSLIPRGEIRSTASNVRLEAPPVATSSISRLASPEEEHSAGIARSSVASATPQGNPIRTAGGTAVADPETRVVSVPRGQEKQPVANVLGAGMAATSPSAKKDPPDTARPAKGLVAAANIATPTPAPVSVPDYRFDPSILNRKANKRYSISKYLSTPKSYIGQIVVPTGMFHLVRSQSDRVAGHRKYWATERKVESRKNNSLGMSSSPSVELEVEPNLAQRLDRLGEKKMTDKMSILTLWFTPRGDCMLVRAEILERYLLGFKKATHYPEGDVDYQTLRISPDAEVLGKAPDEDWEQPERMLSFARNYEKRVGVYKQVLQTKETLALQNVMGSMYKDMMAGAAANALQQQQLQRAVGGR